MLASLWPLNAVPPSCFLPFLLLTVDTPDLFHLPLHAPSCPFHVMEAKDIFLTTGWFIYYPENTSCLQRKYCHIGMTVPCKKMVWGSQEPDYHTSD